MSAYTKAVLADRPLVYYRMNHTETAAESDLGSLGLNAAVHGSVPKIAGALEASGDKDPAASFSFNTNNYLRVLPNSGLNNLGEALTMECWVYPTHGESVADIFIERNITSEPGLLASRLFSISGKWAFTVEKPNRENLPLTAGSVVFGAWSYIVATYDGTATRLFRNAVQIGERAVTGSLRTEAGETFLGVGGGFEGAKFEGFFPLEGRLDECAIYGTALSLARIEAHYNAGITPGGEESTAQQLAMIV